MRISNKSCLDKCEIKHLSEGHAVRDHERYMSMALGLAREAGEDGEAPVGCLVVGADGAIIGRGRNRREKERDATAHAEIEAISCACKALGDWRLAGCSMYVTLEPCPMCAGAIINSRIKRVVFGAFDKKSGAFGSVLNLNDFPFNHKPEITGGVLAERSSAMLGAFFKSLREK